MDRLVLETTIPPAVVVADRPVCSCAAHCETLLAMLKRHGTPVEFAVKVCGAVGEVTVAEAQAAIRKYALEYQAMHDYDRERPAAGRVPCFVVAAPACDDGRVFYWRHSYPTKAEAEQDVAAREAQGYRPGHSVEEATHDGDPTHWKLAADPTFPPDDREPVGGQMTREQRLSRAIILANEIGEPMFSVWTPEMRRDLGYKDPPRVVAVVEAEGDEWLLSCPYETEVTKGPAGTYARHRERAIEKANALCELLTILTDLDA